MHFTITAVARDEGLGIKNVRIHQSGGETIYDIPPQNECAGTRRSLCSTIHNASFDNLHGGYFFPGERDVWLKADDATGKYTGEHHFTMRIDNTPPEMTLKGQFAEATKEVGSAEVPAGTGDQLSLPVYKLEIVAKDGSKDSPLNKRSGVKNIEIWLDGVQQSVPWSSQPCSGPNYSCEMEKTYPVQLSKLTTSGKHVLKVEAVDQVGKRLKREIEFEYFPATGMKDEYVMHYFPLPDGSGNEAEEEHPDRPELAVNVMNGNLVYREQDIEVEGAGVDLEVERYYNSMLPENEETEWGDGWTLAQTPDLDPIKTGGSPVPNQAEILDSSGAIEDEVGLPTAAGGEKFDPALQATLTKKTSGGYELTDETGESATSVAFDASGQTEALLSAGYAKVDYSYEGGELAEIEVTDPATFAADPAELEIPEIEPISEPLYGSWFGSNGTGDGQLKSPADIAVGLEGNLFVLDKGNHRVEKFDPSGKFLAKFGSFGAGNGQFSDASAIATDAAGNILVTDANSHCVQKFSPTGTFLAKFGAYGTGNGQLYAPGGIAVDAAGNIWVADSSNSRVQKFNNKGEFLKVVGAGQLSKPTGIDVDPSSGNVWVADWANNRVVVFNNAGTFVSQFGSAGTGSGQFNHPQAIEVDEQGSVWVGDQANNRVQEFDLAAQYQGQFGSTGSAAGQFSFAYPLGMASDSKGRLWITDPNNHRVQEWLVPVERPAYLGTFGSNGSGDGQLKSPSDVAIGPEGNLFVLDKGNHRVEKFDLNGKFLAKFGSIGSGDGQFSSASAIAIDRDGNVWVTDANSHRIQKFSPEGEFLAKFGSYGTGNGQFFAPDGIATDFKGNIWVADSLNHRLQKFDENGKFLKAVGSLGSGNGQFNKPTSLDVDHAGNVWVADWANHRVSVFNSAGEFLAKFGSFGTGPGQFDRPDAIEIDSRDNVWVGDQGNNRVQRFNLAAQYVGKFGSAGTGKGQFNLAAPMGIKTDERGHLWVTDTGSHRIQQWMLGHYAAEESSPLDLSDGDPEVEVETPGGLVSRVTGNAAGEHTYVHEGDFLTSHDGPEGKTLYKKNTAGLLSEVILGNGTWAKIKYYADNRVESVEVAPNGAGAKTTKFHYEDGPPRRSTVSPPNQPQVVYDIGADGSVFKWWHKEAPPEIIALNGSLGFDKNGKEVAAGDLVLEVEGDSAHGVASIQIIANANQLVSEKTCEQDPDPQIECTRLEDLWVTDTASLSPGVLTIEVIVTNELEKSASKRWSVTIPRTPPPVPGYPVPPKFTEIEKFREDYGLEVVFPVANERELVERIFNLINAWHSPGTPAGEVARASMDRWGVPLRPEDVAEMEYREGYLAQDAAAIPLWAADNAPSTYSGYYVDNRAGGVVRVGFTTAQAASVGAMKAALAASGTAATDRIEPYLTVPARPLVSLGQMAQTVVQNPGAGTIRGVSVDEKQNRLEVAAENVGSAQAWIASQFGAGAPVTVSPYVWHGMAGRWDKEGPLMAGDGIVTQYQKYGEGWNDRCTAGFGAVEKVNGASRHFLLTAGHCATKYSRVWGRINEAPGSFSPLDPIGEMRRNALEHVVDHLATDGAAITLEKGLSAPRTVYPRVGEQPIRITGVADPAKGMPICSSGAISDRIRRGQLRGDINYTGAIQVPKEEDKNGEVLEWWPYTYQAMALITILEGDSGGPVWQCGTGKALGVMASDNGHGLSGIATLRPPRPPDASGTLYPWEFKPSQAPGILKAPGMGNIHLTTAG